MSNKSNIEYLKDICAGNDEALEFIEAIENDIYDLTSEKEDALDEIHKWEEKYDDKKTDYPNTIDAGIGHIHYDADNLQLQLVMEALDEKIKSVGPLKVLTLLQVSPKPLLK
jgi:hypothetical protein